MVQFRSSLCLRRLRSTYLRSDPNASIRYSKEPAHMKVYGILISVAGALFVTACIWQAVVSPDIRTFMLAVASTCAIVTVGHTFLLIKWWDRL
jgi:hypothetical protein